VKLEIAANTPQQPAVLALCRVLESSRLTANASIGRVCGGRVAAVWLDSSDWSLVQTLLEPDELADASVGIAKAEAFIAEVAALTK
jgi:hypothetical protein